MVHVMGILCEYVRNQLAMFYGINYSGPSQIRPPLGPKGVQITEIFRFVKHVSIIFLNGHKCFIACLQKVQYTALYTKLSESRSQV